MPASPHPRPPRCVSGEPLLRASGLQKVFRLPGGGSHTAVDGVDLSVHRGATLGLVGESGCGKTTTGRMLLRLIEPTSGSVVFDGVDTRSLRGASLRTWRRRAQIVFQDPAGALNPRMRVGAAVAEPLEVHGLVRGPADRASKVGDLLERCGMPSSAAQRYPHEFSGGQRQRICIARALASGPELLVCDEPTSALDVSVQAQILNLLKDLQQETGLAYIFISHDMAVIDHMCDRVAVMRDGAVVEEGPRDRVLGTPTKAYTKALLAAAPAHPAAPTL